MRQRDVVHVLATDYDGTVANTFAKSPSGMDVVTAYRYALRDMFGPDDLLERIGGLCNRAPVEIIVAVLHRNNAFASRGHEYFEQHLKELRGLVPAGKGLRNKVNPGLIDELTETLVRVKLKYLLAEVCPEWPKPFDGVLEAFRDIRSRGLHVAIISSGHDVFMHRCFESWGAQCPSLTITDDDMRALGLPPERSCKPSRVLLDLLHMLTASRGTCEVRAYIGDCPDKDRRFAKNGELRFGWFNPSRRARPVDFGSNEIEFHSWGEVHQVLH